MPLMNQCIINDQHYCVTVDFLPFDFAEVGFFRGRGANKRFDGLLSPSEIQIGSAGDGLAAWSGAQRDRTCAFQEMWSICWRTLAARSELLTGRLKSRRRIPPQGQVRALKWHSVDSSLWRRRRRRRRRPLLIPRWGNFQSSLVSKERNTELVHICATSLFSPSSCGFIKVLKNLHWLQCSLCWNQQWTV